MGKGEESVVQVSGVFKNEWSSAAQTLLKAQNEETA